MCYIKYLWYVLRHKYYVLIECFKVGLYWQGIKHDWSKFLPVEFIPYAIHFYGPKAKENIAKEKDKTGYYKAGFTDDLPFDLAWLHHQHLNPHHYQYWVLKEDSGAIKTLPMPLKYVKEMICDWKGAGKAQHNKTSTKDWYLANKHKMVINSKTTSILESLLGIDNHF